MRSSLLLVLITSATAQRGWRKGNWISGFRAPEDVKAQWAGRPPMFGPAPLANRRPVTDAPGKLAKPRTPAPLGEPLWPFPAQRYDADVVTGLALNYREFSHRAFVGTLRRAGYTGDITLITEPRNRLQRGCEAYLRKSGVVAYGLVPDCSASSGGNIKHKTCKWRDGQPPLPLAIIRHALYLAIAKTYSPRSMFYVADYRDTFFQADPFARVVERRGRRLEGLELLVVAEHWPFKQIGNCPFNGGWVRNCWGRAEWDRLRNQSVLCSGSYMGAQRAIVNFETRLLNEVDAHDCHHKGVPSDQGYLNYLFYTGNLPAETFVETRGDGVVNTVGSLDGSRPRHAGYLPPTHVNIGEYWKIRDAEGYVLEDDMTTRSAAVHQWDRFGIEFNPFVSQLGRDVRTR